MVGFRLGGERRAGAVARVLRGVLLLGMVFIFIVGLSLPRAVGDRATLVACSYAGVRLLQLGLYAHASRRGSTSWSAISGFATTVVIGMALLIAGSFLTAGPRVLAWILAVAIDYAGPAWLTRERLRGLQRVAVAHFAERYSLFVIICLGESIVAIGLSANGRAMDANLIAAVALGLLATIGRGGPTSTASRARPSRDCELTPTPSWRQPTATAIYIS
jgi:low temperature requirement protein LtrA